MCVFSAKSGDSSEGDSDNARNVLGVMRAGLFANGLMLNGEAAVQLVLLTAQKPTTSLLDSIVSCMSDELPV